MIAPTRQRRETTGDTRTRKPRTKRQADASRRNGAKSRGPKTQRGKKKSRQNALKHGIFTRALPPKDCPFLVDREEYEELMEQLKLDYDPHTQIEVTLVEALAMDLMRLRHIQALEMRVWSKGAPHPWDLSRVEMNAGLYTKGRSLEEMRQEVAVLNEAYGAIDQARVPELTEDELQYVLQRILHYRQFRMKSVAETEAGLARLAEVEEPDEAVEEERVELERLLPLQKEDLEPWTPEALGCAEEEDLWACLTGEREIEASHREAWQRILSAMVEILQGHIRSAGLWEDRRTRLKENQLDFILGQPERLELLNRYETMVRRNIDRVLSQLQSVRALR